MLNGKFFTGLPPKMMERNASAQNRLESHLFWPDDSQTDSAHDTRQKRRNSFQAESPQLADCQRQTAWTGGADNGVDTRQRFHKEFANSSIHFNDNIKEEEADVGQQAMRKPLIRKALKQDIAIKPTAINMKLPSTDEAQEEYAAIKKHQAFSSKIQFYDYVDNNERTNNKLKLKPKPKMDMNDKKDVERHTKNSPKLQVKGIVRNLHLIDDERRNNERRDRRDPRDGMPPERNYSHYNDERPRLTTTVRTVRNEVRDERGSADDASFGGKGDRHMSRESPVRSQRMMDDYSYNDDLIDVNDMAKEFTEHRSTPRAQNVPKRILKNPIQNEHDFDDHGAVHNDLEHVERDARNMRIRSSPKKHVTYGDEVHEYEPRNGDHYGDDGNANYQDQRERERETEREHGTTYNSRVQIKSVSRPTTGNTQRRQQSNIVINADEKYNNDSTKSSNNNNNYNNYNNKISTKPNNLRQQQESRQQLRITPKQSTSTSTTTTTATPPPQQSPTMDAQKHLRSSLCFSGGEIVAGARAGAGAGAGTPTSEASARRTARSAATTRRICVGLPD